MSNPYRALCAELAEEVEHLWSIVKDDNNESHSLVDRTRAALAQPDPISELVSQCRPLEPEMAEYLTPQVRWRLYGDEAQPEPIAPTDEELLALAREWNSGFESIELYFAADYARAVLDKWGRQ